jgi:hypothetical protein
VPILRELTSWTSFLNNGFSKSGRIMHAFNIKCIAHHTQRLSEPICVETQMLSEPICVESTDKSLSELICVENTQT